MQNGWLSDSCNITFFLDRLVVHQTMYLEGSQIHIDHQIRGMEGVHQDMLKQILHLVEDMLAVVGMLVQAGDSSSLLVRI